MNDPSQTASSSSDEESDDEQQEWPKSVDLGTKWLLKHKVQVQQTIPNLEDAIKNIIQNL